MSHYTLFRSFEKSRSCKTMSKPIGETLNEVVTADDVSRAEAQAKACVEAARQRLVLTRGGLGEVRQSLAALLALTGSTEQVSSRRIEGLLWELKAMVQALSLLTEQSEVDLGRVVPELRAMVQANAKAASPAPTRIVLKLGESSTASDGLKAWPDSRRPTGLKN
jgi:hypothetical protein